MSKTLRQQVIREVKEDIANLGKKGLKKVHKLFSDTTSNSKPKKNKAKRKARNSIQTVREPKSESGIIHGFKFNTSGRPEDHSEFDAKQGIRISGSSMFNYTVGTGATSTLAGFHNSSSATFWLTLAPANLDPRVVNITKNYSFYSFRKIKLTYVPFCPTTTYQSIALAITQDREAAVDIASPTQLQLLSMGDSVLTPAWHTAIIDCDCRGSKLYSTLATSNIPAEDRYQYSVGCAFSYAVSTVDYGSLMIDYVLDLYMPVIPRTTVNLSKDEIPEYELRTEIEPDSRPSTPIMIDKPKSYKK